MSEEIITKLSKRGSSGLLNLLALLHWNLLEKPRASDFYVCKVQGDKMDLGQESKYFWVCDH